MNECYEDFLNACHKGDIKVVVESLAAGLKADFDNSRAVGAAYMSKSKNKHAIIEKLVEAGGKRSDAYEWVSKLSAAFLPEGDFKNKMQELATQIRTDMRRAKISNLY